MQHSMSDYNNKFLVLMPPKVFINKYDNHSLIVDELIGFPTKCCKWVYNLYNKSIHWSKTFVRTCLIHVTQISYTYISNLGFEMIVTIFFNFLSFIFLFLTCHCVRWSIEIGQNFTKQVVRISNVEEHKLRIFGASNCGYGVLGTSLFARWAHQQSTDLRTEPCRNLWIIAE